MSRFSTVLLVFSSAAAVVSGARTETMGAVCSVTEEADDPQYGISFAYDTGGECSVPKCNPFLFFERELPKIVVATPTGDNCVCTGNDKELFRWRVGKIGKCTTAGCWDEYSYQLRKLKHKGSIASEWLTSKNHWKAHCQAGGTTVPSIEEVKREAGMTPDVVPEMREDGMKGDDAVMDDGGIDELDLEDEIEDDDETEKCPELAALVSSTEARVEAESRTIVGYRTIITTLETEVPDLAKTTEEYEKQRTNFQEFFSRILETEGSRTCSVTETDRDNQKKFDVSFAYDMQRACNKIFCNPITFFNDQLKKIVIGVETDKRCTCKLAEQNMFSYKITKYNKCTTDGCWKFYTTIRNIVTKYESGSMPPPGAWLSSAQHYDTHCDAGGKTSIPSPADIARKLKEEGKTDAANAILKEIELVVEIVEEQEDVQQGGDEEQDDLANQQKNECKMLAAKLAEVEAALEDREGVSQETSQRKSELEGRKGELLALRENIATEIKDVAKKMSKKEINSIEKGPVLL